MENKKKKQKMWPKNWRRQIAENLASQGITLTEDRIYDIVTGRGTDIVNGEKVLQEAKKIRETYLNIQKLREELQEA